jgi:DNA-binding NarL/FixJ family response regulator
LIVAGAGGLRDGLRALLTTVPQVEAVGQADDNLSALRMVSEYRPALVLLDSDLLSDEVWTVLKGNQGPVASGPVHRPDRGMPWRQQVAKATDDDATLPPAGKLFATLEKLFPSKKHEEAL